jgi:hypothetical protein
MPIIGLLPVWALRFYGASATGCEPVRSSRWARMCKSSRMYAAATTAAASCSSVAYRYTTLHFAGAFLGPAGSMCCRYAG